MAIVTLLLYQRDMLCASHLNPQRRKSGEIAGLHQGQYGVALRPIGMVSTPNEDIVQEAQQIVNTTDERGLTLRLFGGMAIRFHCPSATHRGLQREYADMDLMGSSEQSKGIKKLFVDLGYAPREIFDAMHGNIRLIYNDIERGRRGDIFLDKFEICHKFDFRKRLTVAETEPKSSI